MNISPVYFLRRYSLKEELSKALFLSKTKEYMDLCDPLIS